MSMEWPQEAREALHNALDPYVVVSRDMTQQEHEDAILDALTPHVEAMLSKARAEFQWAEMLTHQSCPAGKHPDWFIDSEHNLLCPWCEIDKIRDQS